MKTKMILFTISMVVWLLLNWVPDWQAVVYGMLVSAFVAYIAGDLSVQRAYSFKDLGRCWYFLSRYLPLFIWECCLANTDAALRLVRPNMPIHPGIIKVKTRLKSETGLTFLANSITLARGTLCVDVDARKGYLYVHCVDVKAQGEDAATEKIVSRFETVLEKIFE